MRPELIKNILTFEPDGRAVTVCGWVRTKRDSKNLVFVQVNDGSCMASIQLTFDRSNPDSGADISMIEDALKTALTGASVRAEGKLVKSLGSGQAVEVILQKLTVLGECPQESIRSRKKICRWNIFAKTRIFVRAPIRSARCSA